MIGMLLAAWLVPPARPAPAAAPAAGAEYVREIETWRREREQRLRADGGWLTVAGLTWLEPGATRFGAAKTNDVVLPAHSAPPHAGRFLFEAGRVRVEVEPHVAVTLAGHAVTRRELRTDRDG